MKITKLSLVFIFSIFIFAACAQKTEETKSAAVSEELSADASSKCGGCPSAASCGEETTCETDKNSECGSKENAKITFVELGSVNCIPCKQMVPVMESIEKKYGSQIKVVFYDVWKPENKKYAEQYKVKMIPTQVFLDENGKELFRHQGFFAEKEIDKFLQSKGLSTNSSEKS